MTMRRLTRLRADGKLAGVCAGLAHYLDVDVVLVRAAWLVLSIVPGAIIGGVLAYVAAWFVIPEGTETASPSRPRLVRSDTDKQIAGVCGGLADYFGIDSTVVRALWCILSILCGAVVGGVLAYALAWFIIPRPAAVVLSNPTPEAPAAPAV